MRIMFDPKSINSYRDFMLAKSAPGFLCQGRFGWVPDEYASIFGGSTPKKKKDYRPSSFLFDYQKDIAKLAIKKRKFAVFADCGLGKTLIMLEFAKHASIAIHGRKVLIVSPLMVVSQTRSEAMSFYGMDIPYISGKNLNQWIGSSGGGIGITNYDVMTEKICQGNLGALILDESSMLKSMYGKWGDTCIRLGDGLEWKLCLTGTPAPNDRIEYANHAVFLDAFPTSNAFLARYFINRGQTQNRWELKPHALQTFYRDLSHWCIFLTSPSTYGWKDNCESIPPIKIHIHDVDLTSDQREAVYDLTGELFVGQLGGITKRGKLSRIGKGTHNGKSVGTNKTKFILDLVKSWPSESTIIWCHYNDEHALMEKTFPDAGSIKGETPQSQREDLVNKFKSGETKVLISKPKVLGFGLNLQIATRQVFSGLQDSYESFYQAVKRSNRYGSTVPLNVHVPVTEIERPMVENVLRKSSRVQSDTEEQERIFRKSAFNVG